MSEEIVPIPVHIKASDVSLTPKATPRPKAITMHTYQSALNGGEAVLVLAPNRVEAVISVLGVVGTNSNVSLTASAGDGQNLTGVGEGAGAVLQPGMSVTIVGQDYLYLSAVGAGTPPLVSVIQVFEHV